MFRICVILLVIGFWVSSLKSTGQTIPFFSQLIANTSSDTLNEKEKKKIENDSTDTLSQKSLYFDNHVDKNKHSSIKQNEQNLSEVVVTGTMKEISRLESPIPIEVITPALFKKNPVPSLFEAVGMINGVKPQINCNVCNTGDIHINGMEGPYTMVLIDGMPIVSNLATVYGLSGIPNSIVERIESMKGPGSSLYGSEALGGIHYYHYKKPI